MSWIKDVCEDALCGGALGIAKGAFGISLFTAAETEEINSLKAIDERVSNPIFSFDCKFSI
jgi:hypothetical protein